MMSLSAPLRTCILLVAALALCAPLLAQNSLSLQLTQYRQETDPVRKARVLAKLSGDQISLVQKQLKDGEDRASLQTLEQYRDEVRETAAALKATGVNAQKKPTGFKELQISLRESIRRIDDLMFTLSLDQRTLFSDVQSDLLKLHNDLLDALFPKRPDKNAPNVKP
jgi:hypothetical protein